VHDEFCRPYGALALPVAATSATDRNGQDYVLSVAVSHDGQWVVSGSKDRGVQFWDAHSAIVQCMLQGHKNSGEHGAFGSLRYGAKLRRSNIDRSQPRGELVGHWQWRLAGADMYVVSSTL